MTNGTIARLAALGGVLVLAGCLGGGGGGTVSEEELERVRSDPRIVSVRGILERADTLLIPAVHLELAVSGGEGDERERFEFAGDCAATECVLRGGGDAATITLADLTAQDAVDRGAGEVTRLELGERDGFDTLAIAGGDRISEKLSDETITAQASAASWGVWGRHGYAGVDITSASLSDGSVSVAMDGAWPYVFGWRNPTNPEGAGSATWRGPVEAASTRTFARHRGTATLTVPDLAQPRIGAAIEVAGTDIGAPGWKDMPLAQGRFASGTAGQDDYLEGNFHGPNHEEAYGVFDTGAYVGAFGAKRQ